MREWDRISRYCYKPAKVKHNQRLATPKRTSLLHFQPAQGSLKVASNRLPKPSFDYSILFGQNYPIKIWGGRQEGWSLVRRDGSNERDEFILEKKEFHKRKITSKTGRK